MTINSRQFRIHPSVPVDLSSWPTAVDPLFDSKSDYRAELDDHIKRLSEMQQLLYASNRHAVLVIFQAMDAAGKDGAIKHVMSGVNPQGCQVFSFKHPSAVELQHDFLWRTTRDLPERGRIGIFNRSYYEEVLIARVHPEILANEGVPAPPKEASSIWDHRYRSINDFERHLSGNGTKIVKIFLHLSKEEQLRRLIDRIDDPSKNWKFSTADVEERKYWKDYMEAYQDCLNATSTVNAPWYAVPADDKHNARLIISNILLETMQELDMSYPEVSGKRKKELASIRKDLAKS
ncbi:ADP-polyphosphate phosphotransferase [Acidiphilium sp. C61]|jgi:PPK2 family polyphosphate:nucleotide phosphotransferase|uniref:ADP-polyphosphate phosphotransferase n=1 Tax=Acidiphilium sp. C61 TaxID=1671485 RepID=UPI00157AE710|nr:ADP-polyphosphate phosphotransferase [Acidiphilium sp. C61]